jgi:hypothetical protein
MLENYLVAARVVLSSIELVTFGARCLKCRTPSGPEVVVSEFSVDLEISIKLLL